MLTREQRATISALWLGRWRGWQSSEVSVAEYARREGFDADAAYRWRRVLRRTGQWIEAEGSRLRFPFLLRAKGKRPPLTTGPRVASNPEFTKFRLKRE